MMVALRRAFVALVGRADISNCRYSSFLDQINDSFYRPRGLYCMVLTWDPESADLEVGVNINQTIHSTMTPPQGVAQKTEHGSRPSMGDTNSVAFTETAPLIFPGLNLLETNQSAEAQTKIEKLKSAKGFASEYFDKRAQARHVREETFFSRSAQFYSLFFGRRASSDTNSSTSPEMRIKCIPTLHPVASFSRDLQSQSPLVKVNKLTVLLSLDFHRQAKILIAN